MQEGLEGSDPAAKVQAMQKAIMMLLNGEQLPGMFITILQYVLPSEDHTIQKLLLLYLVRPSAACCWHSVRRAAVEHWLHKLGVRRLGLSQREKGNGAR